MILDPDDIALREKLILAGLFLSKFNKAGLAMLGLKGYVEAYNVIGYSLGGRPASVKNYRDEFDPHFPNARSGWHQRPLREHCAKVLGEYGALDVQTFCTLIRSFLAGGTARTQVSEDESLDGSAFAQRLITGLAAERYFEAVQPDIPEFAGYKPENTTQLGCGYDFRLRSETTDQYLAVEVKGLREKSGSLMFTPKEHRIAADLTNRFYLFVVKNFRERPFHEIYPNPLGGSLTFERKERTVIQVSWAASV